MYYFNYYYLDYQNIDEKPAISEIHQASGFLSSCHV